MSKSEKNHNFVVKKKKTACPLTLSRSIHAMRISKESLDITHEPITYGDKVRSKAAGSRGPNIILS